MSYLRLAFGALATAAAVMAMTGSAAALPPGCTQAAQTVTCTYSTPGSTNQFTVPDGIASVHVVAVGGTGGGSVDSSGQYDSTCSPLCGGRAAHAVGELPVSNGQVLQLDVAGNANGNLGGAGGNGGGGGCNGGGGASIVTTVVNNTTTRPLIAAGGGGDGCQGMKGSTTADLSTLGGDAGAPGSADAAFQDGGGGGGGTQSTGGAAGSPDSGSPAAEKGFGLSGGRGGAGGTSGVNVGGAGGGGGAGYWGGGGGGGGSAASGGFDYAGAGGGGGGGSSLVPSGGSVTLDTTKEPEIVISYTVPSAGPGSPSGGPGGSGGTGGSGGAGATTGGNPGSPPPTTMTFGGVTASQTAVSFNLACHGATGTTCRFSAQLSTLEKLLGSKLLALSARKRRHSARVTVGFATFSLATGQSGRFVVPLNGKGMKLLRRFGKLPVTLAVSLLGASPPSTVRATSTIRAPRKRHKRQH